MRPVHVMACWFGALAVASASPAQEESANSENVTVTFETRMADEQPNVEDLTAENASELAGRLFWFHQIQPQWQPPENMPNDLYRKLWEEKRDEVARERVAVVARLLELGAEHHNMPALFHERLKLIARTLGEPDRALALTDAYLAREPEGMYAAKAWLARMEILVHEAIYADPPDHYAALSAVETLRATGHEPEYTAFQLMLIANNAEHKGDRELQRHVLTRVLEYYPDSQFGPIASGKLDRDQWIGKPFELEFVDVLSGEKISMNDYRGKVVLVDFWATWCGPCRAELPKLIEIYEKYRDRGVEIIGVSLDHSPEAVRHYADENPLPWPQFAEGQGIAADFTARWGIHGIPVVFAVDQQGNLYRTDARGKEVEIIEELLAASKTD